MNAPRILVIGHSDVGRRVCGLLQDQGIEVVHLDEPSDDEIRTVLAGRIDGVAVLVHDDIRALRYSLVVEHIRPGVRLFVTMFRRTSRSQLERAVPNSTVLSPAAIAVPSMVAAAIAPEFQVIRRRGAATVEEWVSFRDAATYAIAPFAPPLRDRLRGVLGMVRGQLRPYDRGSGVLMFGVAGLAAVLVVDTLVGMTHESFLRALYGAVLTTSTITTPIVEGESPRILWSSTAALLVMAFTATFAAGIVHHLQEGRHVALFGRRVVPKSGHVIVAGMGQVGLRLAQEIRELGIPVVGIETREETPTLSLAKGMRIPVIIGSATSQETLRRAGLRGARAIVAASSHENDNIAISIVAGAIAPEINIVLRAGTDDAINETRSLFHIGAAVDANALTAAMVAHTMTAAVPYAVTHRGAGIVAIDDAGTVVATYPVAAHCNC